jgi:hypothetical protein
LAGQGRRLATECGLSSVWARMVGLSWLEKSILDLSGNALQPILGTKSAVLKMPKIHLQFLDAVFGCSKLQRKTMCDTQSTAAVPFRGVRRLLKQSHYRLPGIIQRVAVIRMAILRSWRKGNDVFGLALATLTRRYPLQKRVKFRCSLSRSNCNTVSEVRVCNPRVPSEEILNCAVFATTLRQTRVLGLPQAGCGSEKD